MKRIKMKYIILILLITFLLYFCNYSQYRRYSFFLDLKNGPCASISESKEVGVFLYEYQAEFDKYNFKIDSLIIDEIWLEKCWESTKFHLIIDTIYPNCYKIMLKTKNNFEKFQDEEDGMLIVNPYFEDVTNKVNGTGRCLLRIDFPPNGTFEDTLIYPVFKGSYSNYKKINEKLGEIKLFKKK